MYFNKPFIVGGDSEGLEKALAKIDACLKRHPGTKNIKENIIFQIFSDVGENSVKN